MRSLFCALLVVCSVSSARADEATKPFTPRAGDMELQVTPALLVFNSTDLQEGTSSGQLGVSGGFGYCLTNVVELGGSAGFGVSVPASGSATSILQLEPFVKFNFGTFLSPHSRLNPYVAAGFNIIDSSGSVFVAPVVNLGMEFMVTHTWGISLYIPVDVVLGGDLTVGYGIGYGVATYF